MLVTMFRENVQQILASLGGNSLPFIGAESRLVVDAKQHRSFRSERSASYANTPQHPLRQKAGRRPVYSIPIILFLDDVSGNRSRQWNKHYCCYMSNGALPREQIEAQFHVRFVATSPNATPLEIMRGIRDDVECVLFLDLMLRLHDLH
jgi:hypothetical protein